MKKSSGVFVLLTLILLAAASGGYVLYKKYEQKQQLALQQKEEEDAKDTAIRQAALEERKERYAQFEALLNGLIKDISEQAKNYKIRRTVLKEILDPYNFKTQGDAAQSYKAFIEVVIPSLRDQADKVMGVFDNYQVLVKQVLKDIPDEKKAFFLREWDNMIKDKIEKLVSFFQQEEKILQAYKNLLEFYYKNSKAYSFQKDTGKIIFLNKQAQEKEIELVLEIETLLLPKP